MIRRRELVRHLVANGCELVRQGGRHEVWRGPRGARSTVPRHRQIPLGTARAICRQLEVPLP